MVKAVSNKFILTQVPAFSLLCKQVIEVSFDANLEKLFKLFVKCFTVIVDSCR